MTVESAALTALGLLLTVPDGTPVNDLGNCLRVETAAPVELTCPRKPFSLAWKSGRFWVSSNDVPVRVLTVEGNVKKSPAGWTLTESEKTAGTYVLIDYSWKDLPLAPEPLRLKMNEGARIPFVRPLPTTEKGASGYNNPEWSMPGLFTDSADGFGFFMKCLRDTVAETRRLLRIDGRTVVCNHNWFRDHTHQMKGWCHWEYDNRSFLDFIFDHPRKDGLFYEMVKQMDDLHWQMVDGDSRILFPEDHLALIRLNLEADVEYLAVEAANRYWRMSGDHDWMARRLPTLERAINRQTSDPKHWNAKYGLCIRPFTIDTWDFTPLKSSGLDRRIHPWETLPAMHGDNTGVYQAMRQLAAMNRHLGREARADEWEKRASALKEAIFRNLWNGRFFVHQKFFDGEKGIDDFESIRLSLSDAYALNRGILTEEQARGLVDEYQARRKTTKAFAEWFTVDPPYEPTFGNHEAGTYVNGAISPFTAGELALGAFACGRESYAWDILTRLQTMVKKDGDIYFLYNPKNGEPISVGSGPSAWGAAALLNAIDEGLAGIINTGFGYDEIAFSPRWPVTPYRTLRYLTGYEALGKTVDCRYVLTEKGLRYRLESPAKIIRAHILLPAGKSPKALFVNGHSQEFTVVSVDASRYLDTTVTAAGLADFEVIW